jgi:hypothetical protein
MLTVVDQGQELAFTFADLMRFHGPHSPGGVAHAFKVLEVALPLLEDGGPCERRALTIRTAFGGPGARDGFELVTRAVSDGRYTVDSALARPELGRARERFVFELGAGSRTVTLVLREGHVSDEFIDLARAARRTPEQEARLTELKEDMARRLTALPAHEVYDATVEAADAHR